MFDAMRPTLTAKEIRVLREIGHPSKVMAWRLGVSETTVKEYVRSMRAKFGVETRVQLAVAAWRAGFPVDELPSQMPDAYSRAELSMNP